MRSWDKYCEDTEKAIMRLSENITQPVVFRGFLLAKKRYVGVVIVRGMTRFDMDIPLRVLRDLAPNSVECFTEIKSMRGDAFFYSPRATGIPEPCGMRKPLNRVGDAFGWPKVRYKNLIPWEGVLAEYGVEGLAHNWK